MRKALHEYQLDDYRAAFEAAGQGHVFRFAAQFSPSEAARLAKDLSKVDLATLVSLQAALTASPAPRAAAEPAPMLELQDRDWPWRPNRLLTDARARGEELLRGGKVAAIVVAGGQGTRLGFSEPKGLYPLWPHSRRLLFDGFAEQLRALGKRYGVVPKLYVMTSTNTDHATRAAFISADFFGLAHDRVAFFKQGKLPSLTPQGKLILAQRHRIAFNPDGHGGIFEALKRRGCIEEMRADGTQWLFYFQVDNPFVRVAEPEFIGALANAEAEIGVKAVRKTEASEKVGVIGLRGGVPTVVEYSELSDQAAAARAADGSLLWKAGNTAIHGFSYDFMARVTEGKALPLHGANKVVPHVDAEGRSVTPDAANAWKFERFIFDAFPQAKKLVNAECARELEFLPVKSADGPTSPAQVREAMQASFRKALRGNGFEISDQQALEISSALWADQKILKEYLAANRAKIAAASPKSPLLLNWQP